jgi:hypothetical protein
MKLNIKQLLGLGPKNIGKIGRPRDCNPLTLKSVLGLKTVHLVYSLAKATYLREPQSHGDSAAKVPVAL